MQRLIKERGYETALRQNDYWLGRLQTIKMFGRDPGEILTRTKRIDAVTPQVLQDVGPEIETPVEERGCSVSVRSQNINETWIVTAEKTEPWLRYTGKR